MIFLNSGLIFTCEVFILFKKVWGPIGEMDFDISWNFVKEHVLNDFMKYQVNQTVNKDLNVELSPLAICHSQIGKKWCLQNFHSVKKWVMLEIVDENASKIMKLPNNLVLICKI